MFDFVLYSSMLCITVSTSWSSCDPHSFSNHLKYSCKTVYHNTLINVCPQHSKLLIRKHISQHLSHKMNKQFFKYVAWGECFLIWELRKALRVHQLFFYCINFDVYYHVTITVRPKQTASHYSSCVEERQSQQLTITFMIKEKYPSPPPTLTVEQKLSRCPLIWETSHKSSFNRSVWI